MARSPVLRAPTDRPGVKPVVFDVLGPDRVTSLLPDGLKLVLHVNPKTMRLTYKRNTIRIQTKGGYVLQHWGNSPTDMTLEMSTGGFMRLGGGLSNVTGGFGSLDVGGTRRETLAHDRYQDLLALFHHNGAVYDSHGGIALQGQIRVTFDGASYYGWFNSFSVSESSSAPYQFALSAGFTIEHETQSFHAAERRAAAWGYQR